MDGKSSGSSGRKSGGGSGSTDGVEGEGDQDESSSSSSSNQMRESIVLESFRSEWKKELADSRKEKTGSIESNSVKTPQSTAIQYNIEDKAKVLFQMGIENEEKGNFYEAVQFYKKAFQLVPDIELRLAQQNSTFIPDSADEEKHDDDDEEKHNENEDDKGGDDKELSSEEEYDSKKIDLKSHLQNWMYRQNNSICTPQHPTYGARHISDLPVEVILYILRWVAGTDLDMRSLEQVSAVSRGLYVCSRDEEIWRLACYRVWGVRCSSLGSYNSWREMFMFRGRVHTAGCYISKTTYIRPGENSFQDRCYRAWHLVQYFRYFRFFADGGVLMLTSNEEPVNCVGLLKSKPPIGIVTKAAICSGYYRLLEPNIVSIIVSPLQPHHSNRHSRFHQFNQLAKQTFHIELEIVTYRNKLHGQLVWRRYSLLTTINGVETITDFEIIASRFPPLWFSRVKSYHAESHSPLL